LQLKRLRAFLTECGANVPYYRELFRSLDFDPRRTGAVSDLARLPLLTKDTIRREFDRLKSDGPEAMKLSSTTGSTGDALRFYICSPKTAPWCATLRSPWCCAVWRA